MDPTDARILDDVTVVDLSTFVTGGFCSLMLANQGADVIKIERPGTGDDIRQSGPPFVDGESPYYWTLNYDKRSVELDLKNEAGREALLDLVREADVFVQNFRPGVADRLGVDYGTLSALNPGLVYCTVSAYGDSGPWSQRPGYDLLVQGMSGIMSVTGEPDGRPVKVGLPQTDLITGMWAAFGVVTALLNRERTGEGDRVELGMLDAALPWLTKQAGKVFAGESPSRMGTKDPVLAPYQTYRTKDGHLNVACLNERLWLDLCAVLDRPDLAADERFADNAARVEHMDDLAAEIESTLTTRTSDEWMDALVDAGVPAGPVQSVEEALSNEQVDARGVVSEVSSDDGDRTIPTIEHPLNFAGAESGFRSPPPRLGEHSREVFAELGYSTERLDDLAAAGAFGDPDS